MYGSLDSIGSCPLRERLDTAEYAAIRVEDDFQHGSPLIPD
jgi:hypothetical protein